MATLSNLPQKHKLPKLMACMTKGSLETMRNQFLYTFDFMDSKCLQRRKIPLHQCLVIELKEAGFRDSSAHFQDLIYDNVQLCKEDEIGIIVDLRKQPDYLEHIANGLQKVERDRERGNTKAECMNFFDLAVFYSDKGKGILWLAEKFYLASIAVASKYLLDGGRLKGCCKYHYAKFLLDKFPGADTEEESFSILTEVRHASIGKAWLLWEEDEMEAGEEPETLFHATAMQLHRVLLHKSRSVRKEDPSKAERLARLAERRAIDGEDLPKTAEAVIDVGICQLLTNSLNNALRSFERAHRTYTNSNNIEGICDTKMHLAAVLQRMGRHDNAAQMLTDMGTLAIENDLNKHLGRALHLLGELHLRRERPELGTQHLREAFNCFMGMSKDIKCISTTASSIMDIKNKAPDVDEELDDKKDERYAQTTDEIYLEEAEQSRVMMAVSAGQELMASYFILMHEASKCNVAKIKIIEWKLAKSDWWVDKLSYKHVPCVCSKHNQTALDIMRSLRANRLATEREIQKEKGTENFLPRREADIDDLANIPEGDTENMAEAPVNATSF